MGSTRPLLRACRHGGAEPYNAWTHAAFLIAAGIILVRQRRLGWVDKPLTAMALLTGSVGVGSFSFHTTPNGLTLWADILPIALVIFSFFFLALRRFLGFGYITATLTTASLLMLTSHIGNLLKPILGASSPYSPGLIATFGVALAVPLLRRERMPRLLFAAGAAFSLALIFRMLDAPHCEAWPTGTHFLWHGLNGVALTLALLAAERGGLSNEKASLGFA
ncbi:ceramidase domain-containing protein [Aminobacter anthyllidis]|uniref:ceramidase domain-containing protein n=1 Tax=Aminobacter anthyllidis TaxID=1035067 RepID=UPI00313CF7E2